MCNYIKIELQLPSWNNNTLCSHLIKDYFLKFKFQTSYLGISNIFTSQLFQRPLRSTYLKETGVSNGHTTWPKAQDSDHWCGQQRLPLAPLRSLPRAAGNLAQVNPPTTLPIPAVLGHWSKFKLRGHLSCKRLSSSCYLYLLCHCHPCRFFSRCPLEPLFQLSTSSTPSPKVATACLTSITCSLCTCVPLPAAAPSPMHPSLPSRHPTPLSSFLRLPCGRTPSLTEDFGIWLTASSPQWVLASSTRFPHHLAELQPQKLLTSWIQITLLFPPLLLHGSVLDDDITWN